MPETLARYRLQRQMVDGTLHVERGLLYLRVMSSHRLPESDKNTFSPCSLFQEIVFQRQQAKNLKMDPIDNGPFAPNKCPICGWTNMKGAEVCGGTRPTGGPCVWTPPEQDDDYCERICEYCNVYLRRVLTNNQRAEYASRLTGTTNWVVSVEEQVSILAPSTFFNTRPPLIILTKLIVPNWLVLGDDLEVLNDFRVKC